jgi:hypothetical protein
VVKGVRLGLYPPLLLIVLPLLYDSFIIYI